jgi:hypothetical protein
MWRWVISSDRAGARLSRSILLVALCASLSPAAPGRVFTTLEDALGAAFPGCTIERRTAFLTDDQRARIGELAGSDLDSSIAHPYSASCADGDGGTAYFDAHRVRTLPETVMVVIAPDGTVKTVEVLSFDEPEEYIPRRAWYEQFEGKALDDDLELWRGIDGVTGATLTARSTTGAVRRILALHSILVGESQ